MTSDDDMLGVAGGKYPAKKRGKSGDLGELHQLLTGGLPDFVHDGVLDVKELGESLSISYQAIYKWFERNGVNPGRVDQIVTLSENSLTGGPEFKALTRDDFWPFMGR